MKNQNKKYWRENVRYVTILLLLWFSVSFGCGILLKDALDKFHIGGFPLGFWFAQQGAIYGFIVIIALYVWLMNRLDKKYNLND